MTTPCRHQGAPSHASKEMETGNSPNHSPSSTSSLPWKLAVESTSAPDTEAFSKLHHELLCLIHDTFPSAFKVIPLSHTSKTTFANLRNHPEKHLQTFPVKKTTIHDRTKYISICSVETSASLFQLRSNPSIRSFLKEHNLHLRCHLWTHQQADVTRPFYILGQNPKVVQSNDVITSLPISNKFRKFLQDAPIQLSPTIIYQSRDSNNKYVQVFAIETLQRCKKQFVSDINKYLSSEAPILLPARLRYNEPTKWIQAIAAQIAMN